jgi:uridine kinase
MPSEISSVRRSTLAAVADRLLLFRLAHPVRVAVDGRTTSGKTTFADELAATIRKAGRSVVRASVDDFHQPAVMRYRQGRLSPDGYYEDARDLGAVRKFLLEPLGPDGDRSYATQTFDLERDQSVEPEMHRAKEDAVLIVDGTFLQRTGRLDPEAES